MRRLLALMLALALLLPGAARAEWLDEDVQADYEKWCTLEGDTLTVREGLRVLGGYVPDWIYNPETDDWDETEDPAAEQLFEENDSLYFYWDEVEFSRIQFPNSLEMIGCEAFFGQDFTEFTLPKGLKKVLNDAFYCCTFGVFRIEAELPWTQIRESMSECHVLAWDVPEDHPLYTVRDGALYTKDGKTLLNYPNGRTDAHWDVPAGTERIARYAIRNEYLKTVSLPVGLQAVEDWAFAGCGWLQAVAFPLTVREIGRDVFDECVSLELVSLPQGLTADKDEDGWSVYYQDDAIFRGDNGDTWISGDPYDEYGGYDGNYRGYYDVARLTGDGEMVPLYRNAAGGEAVLYLPDGYVAMAMETDGGRCRLEDLQMSRTLGWAPLARVRLISNETLFRYARGALRPEEDTAPGRVWDLEFDLRGPFVMLYWDDYCESVFLPLTETKLYREADGPEGDYGIAACADPYWSIPLMDAPGGEETEKLHCGDQVKILEENGGFVRVSTGFAEGWLAAENVKKVPKTEEGK
ncbi:MAG: leucine-rich repeat protein [Clostridia bacterium]|nr:leucine-rich repeat protein [Clostridia bacterium]